MAVKTYQSLARQSLDKMAVQTDWFSTRADNGAYVAVLGLDVSGSRQTVLSLTGKFSIEMLHLQLLTAAQITDYVLTIDGVVIHSSIGVQGTFTHTLHPGFGQLDGNTGHQGVLVDKSFLLEMDMGTDASISLYYQIRPIL